MPIIHLVCAPPPPHTPQKNVLHKHCFHFLLGFTILPREFENNTPSAEFLGVSKVEYGYCEKK